MSTLIISVAFLATQPSWASYRELYPGQKEKETLARFINQKNKCSQSQADPCENEKLNTFNPKEIQKEIKYFKNASREPLITEAEQRALSADSRPSQYKFTPSFEPAPEVIQNAMTKLLSCKYLKGTGMQLSMAQEEPEEHRNIFSNFSNRSIYFGKNAFSGFQKQIPTDQLPSVVAFVLAHELGHFITETYVRSNLNSQLTASGSPGGIEIQRRFSKLSSNDERRNELVKMGHHFHDEVDAVAVQLLAECGFPIPSTSALMLTFEEDPDDLNYCTYGRKRALTIHKNLEEMRKR